MKFSNTLFSGIYNVICLGVILLIHTNLALRNHVTNSKVLKDIFFFFLQLHFPVFDLAKADEEQVLKLWQGLGIILEP
jgi:hypothetical protein